MSKLDKINEVKAVIESNVADLVREFEYLTGMTVTSIDIERSMAKCIDEYGKVVNVNFAFDWSKVRNE